MATPLTTLAVVAPESVPPPGLFPSATLTDPVAPVTVFPKLSCTATFTSRGNATPA